MIKKVAFVFFVILYFSGQFEGDAAKISPTKHEEYQGNELINKFISSTLFRQIKKDYLNSANFESLLSKVKDTPFNLSDSGTISFPIDLHFEYIDPEYGNSEPWAWIYFISNETIIEGLALPKISVSQNGNLWSFRLNLNLHSFKIHGDYKLNHSSSKEGWRLNTHDFYDYHISSKGLDMTLEFDIKLPLFGKMRVENSFFTFYLKELNIYFDQVEFSWPVFEVEPFILERVLFENLGWMLEVVFRYFEWVWNVYSMDSINKTIEDCSVSDILLGKYACLNWDWWLEY